MLSLRQRHPVYVGKDGSNVASPVQLRRPEDCLMVLAYCQPHIKIGVKFEGPLLDLPDLRNIEEPRWDPDSFEEEVRMDRLEAEGVIRDCEDKVRRWREAAVEGGQNLARCETGIHRDFGASCTLAQAIGRMHGFIETAQAQIEEGERGLWEHMFPDGLSLDECRAAHKRAWDELMKKRGTPIADDGFCIEDQIREEVWRELTDHAQAGSWLPESEDIYISLFEALGTSGACTLLKAMRAQDKELARQLWAFVTERERTRGRPVFNRVLLVRNLDGTLGLTVDQLSASDHLNRTTSAARSRVHAQRRAGRRRRESRGKPSRRRGSRRSTSRSAGGGSSGDDPPPGEPGSHLVPLRSMGREVAA
jgi:hypothetical protein